MKYIRGCEINIIEIADDFFEAYDRCLSANDRNEIVAIPAFVNGLFACELYFKSMIKKKIINHNLIILFENLDEEKQRELEMVENDDYTLVDLLKGISNGFEVWRYCYEDNNKKFEEEFPFLYTEKFLRKYLPVLKKMAHKYKNEWKYIIDKENNNRFLLGQIKDSSKDIVLWFGINPSTATPEKLDKTINKIIKISKNNNFDNWLVANVYSQRTTNPYFLDTEINNELHKHNMQIIKSVLEEYKNITIVFAYGNIITIRDYLQQCLNDVKNLINDYNINVKIIDYTKEGHPKHPLYAKDDIILKDADLNGII